MSGVIIPAQSTKTRKGRRTLFDFAPPQSVVGEQWIRLFFEDGTFNQDAFNILSKYLLRRGCEVHLCPAISKDQDTSESNASVIFARTQYHPKVLDTIRKQVSRYGQGMLFRQVPEGPSEISTLLGA